ncbi:hypothetical protein C4J98_4534 [Pseudomonas orientalis]|uniref:hypothetical protein n=1 Tax=Pseudomonas orientalis TaxID=76758 RepID=UPI000F58CAAC|nr:hypothetical protein [Pseudomonas orientalis]AZE85909.1 hypothetical protein C4J98_4534 [Pseudomonas orientalis]
MLSIEDQEFISKEMKIALESIVSKFGEVALLPYKKHLESAISFFICSIRAQNRSGYICDGGSCRQSPAQIEINNYSAELSETLAGTEAISILESLRHAFSSFAYNGLHQLFTRQENEDWHPKVILDEELMPNDISELPSLVTLYRGTDIAEYNSFSYGQSWTTCKEIAYLFAFTHYVGQPWFNKNERVVLKAEVSKRYVYFSNQSGEFEVVVNVGEISHVEKVA